MGNDCVTTKAVRVLTDYDFSDHYPIFTSIVCNGWVQPARVHKPRLDRNKLKEASAAVRDSNYWAPLLTLMDDSDLVTDEVVKCFVSTSEKIAKEAGLTSMPKGQDRQPKLSAACVRLIRARRAVARRIAAGDNTYETIMQHAEMKNQVRTRVTDDKKKNWAAFVARGAALRATKPRQFWSWIRNISKFAPNRQSSILPPIYDAQGELAVTPQSIVNTWTDYYRTLNNDPYREDVSANPNFWPEQYMPLNSISVRPEWAPIPAINEPFTW
jgi:hypothetical protein